MPRMLSPFVALVAASLVSAACATVGPDYERPQMPSAAQFRFVPAPQAETLADVPWWEVFKDPQLQALIREALAQNLDVRVAAARVEEARARAGIAKSYYYPQVDGTASYQARAASSSSDADTTHQSGVYGFRIAWEADIFGRIRRENESATALYFATEQARRGVLVTLVGDLASNYFLLRELDLQLEIAHRTLDINDRTIVYFQDRLNGGVSNRLELDRIQANRALTASAIPELERQIAVVENGISLLLGHPPGPIARPTSAADMAGQPIPPAVPPGLPATLLTRRPDVVEAEHLLISANADVGAAKALFFPVVSLSGFLGGVSGDLTTFLGGDGGVASFGAGLLQPIFNGKRIRRNYEATQARFTAAVAEYQRSALNAYREVANALISIQKLSEIRAEQEKGVAALTDAADLARSRYDSGLASYIEILTADQDLFNQQIRLAQTVGSELRARAELYRTLGGGWQQQP